MLKSIMMLRIISCSGLDSNSNGILKGNQGETRVSILTIHRVGMSLYKL